MFSQFQEKLKFTPKDAEFLKTVGNLAEHSSIVTDFDATLDLLRAGKLAITPAHQLNLDSANKVNAALKNPIELGLQRPQGKSYPHVLGLYWLLRASGLGRVDSLGKKPALILDTELDKQWQNLNQTERYFSLLETWLLRAYPEILEERAYSWGLPENFNNWAWFYGRMPDEGLIVKGNRDTQETIKYHPRYYNIGLLDLFGFIEIQRGAVLAGEAWQIDEIKHNPLGDAVIRLIYSNFFSEYDKVLALGYDEDETASIGFFQSYFQPYFPDWQKNIVLPKWVFRKGQHIFKVSWGKIWRRLAIDADAVLDDLAMLILQSVEFDSDHLYRFSYQGHSGLTREVNHPYLEDAPFTSEERVGDIPLKIGQSMIFLFDFGDNWEFIVSLEAINPEQHGTKILESRGESPQQYYWGDGDDEFVDFDH